MPRSPDTTAQVTPDDEQRGAALAQRIAASGLIVPAALCLELLKPLCFVGSQMLLMAAPALAGLGWGGAQRWGAFLEDRRNVERLLKELDGLGSNAARAGGRPDALDHRLD
jgi:hypothetical protein